MKILWRNTDIAFSIRITPLGILDRSENSIKARTTENAQIKKNIVHCNIHKPLAPHFHVHCMPSCVTQSNMLKYLQVCNQHQFKKNSHKGRKRSGEREEKKKERGGKDGKVEETRVKEEKKRKKRLLHCALFTGWGLSQDASYTRDDVQKSNQLQVQ